MKVLIAPDSFKGSMTAEEVSRAMKKGIEHSGVKADISIIPMADGGEGTMQSLIQATKGSMKTLRVQDPLGREREAMYGITGDGKTAVIELASASGLPALAPNELNPAIASTYGTGQLIVDALDEGLRDFIICLGGSATNDGGAGILSALGYQFLDRNGKQLKPGGLALRDLAIINGQKADSRLETSTFRVASDVDNPLIGPNGASRVFGPQKGADGSLVHQLDQALTVYADCIERETGLSVHHFPGAGAAGGTAAGLLSFLNAELCSGVELVMEVVKFEEQLVENDIDLVLSGEGKLDSQTASGKVVLGLARAAKRHGIPLIALAGTVEGDLTVLHEQGLTAAFSITRGPISLEKAMREGERFIEESVEQLFRFMKSI